MMYLAIDRDKELVLELDHLVHSPCLLVGVHQLQYLCREQKKLKF